MNAAILVIDHTLSRSHPVARLLARHGFRTEVEPAIERAFARLEQEPSELVILEAEPPRADCPSVCRGLRGLHDGPILVWSEHAGMHDEIVALDAGADDYLVKPIPEQLLLARVRALTRRWSGSLTRRGAKLGASFRRAVNVGQLRVSSSARTVHVRGRFVGLTTAEFDLLWLLVSHAGEALSRDFITRCLHGHAYDGLDRTIDIRVSRLRTKLGDRARQPALIMSVRGVGYQLVC